MNRPNKLNIIECTWMSLTRCFPSIRPLFLFRKAPMPTTALYIQATFITENTFDIMSYLPITRKKSVYPWSAISLLVISVWDNRTWLRTIWFLYCCLLVFCKDMQHLEYKIILLHKGTAVAQWLRCYATNGKVAGSIPAGISRFFIDIKFFWSHNGSIQPLTEMSTWSISWG